MSDNHSPLEKQGAGDILPPDATIEGDPNGKPPIPPTTIMGLVIIALVGILVVMTISRRSGKSAGTGGDHDLKNLQAEVDARRAELNRQRQEIGLGPVQGGSEPIEEIANRLKKDSDSLVGLANRFQQMLTEKDAEISAGKSEIIRSEQLRKSLAAEGSRLQSELQRQLVNGSDMESVLKDLGQVKAQRDALSAELTTTRQQLKTAGQAVSTDDYADLKRRFDETLRAKEFFEGRVKELEGDLSKAKLFAASEEELLPAAVALFRSLRGLEGTKDSDNMNSYSNLGVELGANVLHTLNFETGSAALSAENEMLIRNLTAEVPDGDLLFVVGYASKTGNVLDNQKLSSDRATAVAQYYSGVKRPEQAVQAVYLGQTERFGSSGPERNQVVEIWRIRQK